MTHSLEELLKTATQKFGYQAKKVFTSQGGEIDDIKLIRNDDILYITGDEPFIKVDQSNENIAPNVILTDHKKCTCSENISVPSTNTACSASNIHTHNHAACCSGAVGGIIFFYKFLQLVYS